jgi:malonyl-CoA O-methyltransferase
MVDKEKIKKTFSRISEKYDNYASIQNYTATKLIDMNVEDNFINILEIGAGTGIYTQLLTERFPYAKIYVQDISYHMLKIAADKLFSPRLSFFIGDGEDTIRGKYCLITSNACLQWFSQLEKTLIKYKNLLSPKGAICFSTFGPLTLKELGASLKKVENKYRLSAESFFTKGEIEIIFKRWFKNFTVKEETITYQYPSLKDLLTAVKYTGGISESKRVWTRKMFDKLEEAYRKSFGDFFVTYQIFYCRGYR